MRKFTLFMALALIVSALNAQQMRTPLSKHGRVTKASLQAMQSMSKEQARAIGTLNFKQERKAAPAVRAAGDVIFFDDFESNSYETPVGNGWLTVNNPVPQSEWWANWLALDQVDWAWDLAGENVGNGNYTAGIGYSDPGDGPHNDWLISPAIHLTAGTAYRISFFVQMQGYFGQYEKLALRIGTSQTVAAMGATPLWYSEDDIYPGIIASVIYTPATTGNYYLGFYSYSDEDAWYTALDDVKVTESGANALELTPGAYYTQIPTTQILPPVRGTVQNVGSATQTNVTMTATLNGTPVGTSTPVSSLASSATANMVVTPATAHPAMGSNSVVSNVTSTEGATASNTMNFTGTNDTYAVDASTATDDGIGSGGGAISFGQIFEITTSTTILQAIVGFGYDPSVLNFSISLYSMTGDLTVNTTPLFTQSATRTGLGLFTFDVPATTLTPGKYALIVNQLDDNRIDIMFDNNFAQAFYLLSGSDLVPESGYGALAIRMILGEQQDNDAAITAITAPTSGMNLSATEPVTATIRNNGINAITSMTLELTVDGGTPVTEAFSSTLAAGAQLNYTLTHTADVSAAGTHTIKVRAILTDDGNPTNDAMTVTITNTICDVITTFPWTEGFEGATFPPNCWSNIDADGDGYSWVINAEGIVAHSGSYCATSASYDNATGHALTPNNYLITPQLVIPATGSATLTYWVAAQDPSYPADHYSVKVSTTNINTASFTQIFDETLTAATSSWVPRTVDLTAYAGQSIYIAFVHNDCTDEFVMKLDDITVEVTNGVNNNQAGNITVYPNPVSTTFVINNAAGSQAKIYDISGKMVYTAPVTTDNQTVDISNISAGIYFLELQSSTSKSTVKLIKK